MTAPQLLSTVKTRAGQVDTEAWAAWARLLWLRLRERVTEAVIVTGRYLAVWFMLLLVDRCWSSWADHTGIAQWHTTYRTRFERDHDGRRRRVQRAHRQLDGVPKVKRRRYGQHSGTIVIKVPAGHDVASLEPAMSALRHQAHAQRATIREVAPGQAAIDLLRRDPLDRVVLTPHATGPDAFAVARDERGNLGTIDLAAVPHLLMIGVTGAGKSSMLNALARAWAPTPDVLLMVDLKYGLEALALGDRWSQVITTPQDAATVFGQVQTFCGKRAQLLSQLLCQNVTQAEQRYGIRLRRVRLVIDEVAELSEDALEKLERVVSLVRALGVNVIVAGQRFGADQGKKVTSIRSGLTGRVVGKVNDPETARMGLPNIDGDTLDRLLNIRRPGEAFVQLDEAGSFWRFGYQSISSLRPVGQAHADKAVSLDALAAEDDQITRALSPSLEFAGRR